MPVVAELVVGHEHLWPHLTDHLDEEVGGLGEVGVPEGVAGPVVAGDRVAVRVPLHAGVAVAAEAAEVAVVVDPELAHRLVELALPVLGQGVVLLPREVGQLGRDDRAAFAAGAGDQRDPDTFGDVLRHRGTAADRLVVGMGVDEQETTALEVGHVLDPRRSGRSAGRKGRSGSSQSRPSRSSGASHRSWSWSSPGRGLPTAMLQTATWRRYDVPIGCAPSSHRSMTTRQPSSSATSRSSAAVAVSPGSTLPPGNSQRPAVSGGVVRRAASRNPDWTIAAPTTNLWVTAAPRSFAQGASRAFVGACGARFVVVGTGRVARSSFGTPTCPM